MSYTVSDENIEGFIFLHQTETEFYSYLAGTLDIPCPKVFKTLPWVPGKSQGVLHMEDMTRKGVTTGFYPSVNIAQIKEVVKYLAHMHRIVLTADENHQKLWKEKYNANQWAFASYAVAASEYEEFLDICKDQGESNILVFLLHMNSEFFQITSELFLASTRNLVEIRIMYDMHFPILGKT